MNEQILRNNLKKLIALETVMRNTPVEVFDREDLGNVCAILVQVIAETGSEVCDSQEDLDCLVREARAPLLRGEETIGSGKMLA